MIPVLISVVVIVLVAVLQDRSKALAAVVATMPLTVTLGLWIVFAANPEPLARADFARGLVLGIVPTMLFLVAAWLATRGGWSFLATAAAGYATWALALGAVFGVGKLVD